jgi:hypothetical protein
MAPCPNKSRDLVGRSVPVRTFFSTFLPAYIRGSGWSRDRRVANDCHVRWDHGGTCPFQRRNRVGFSLPNEGQADPSALKGTKTWSVGGQRYGWSGQSATTAHPRDSTLWWPIISVYIGRRKRRALSHGLSSQCYLRPWLRVALRKAGL